MRLGELLLQHQVITPDQLRAGLEAQGNYGGRLGTNLFQLGYIDIDLLSRALGQQRGVPAALRKHVAAIDKRVIALFSPRAVESYRAIPIGYTTTKPSRVIVACVNPATIPLEELAFAAGTRVDIWIAPELLIQESLEKYYGATPIASRYVEVTFGARDAPASSAPPMAARAPVAADPVIPRAARVPSASGPAPVATSSAAPPPSRSPARPVLGGLTPPPPPPSAASAAAPRQMLSPPPPPPAAQSIPVLPEPPDSEPPDSAPIPKIRSVAPRPPSVPAKPALRMSISELPPDEGWDAPDDVPAPPPASPSLVAAPWQPSEVPAAAHHPQTAPPEALRPFIDQAEASRMIEMATSKDHVGRVLEDWLRSTFGCGLVLIVKNEMAVGWKGFFPDAEDLIEAVAVPLNKPSMFTAPYDTRLAFCGPPPDSGAKLNQLMWKLLRCAPPSEVLVCPVVVGKRTVNLLYAHATDDESPLTDTNLRQAQVLAGDATAAYMRLIRRERAKA